MKPWSGGKRPRWCCRGFWPRPTSLASADLELVDGDDEGGARGKICSVSPLLVDLDDGDDEGGGL
jgi:hypothetical protein